MISEQDGDISWLSRIDHTNTDLRSTPQALKSVDGSFSILKSLLTVENTKFFNALISFFVRKTGVSVVR